MSTFELWIKKLKKDIAEGISKARAYEVYVNRIQTSKEPFIGIKRTAEKPKTDGNAIIFESGLEIINLKPSVINMRMRNDWEQLFESKNAYIVNSIIRPLSIAEEQHVLRDLVAAAEECESLRRAVELISADYNLADTVLVNPLRIVKLMQERKLFSKFEMSKQSSEGKGQRFEGICEGLDAYYSPELNPDLALVYDKELIEVKISPTEIAFDDDTLYISESLVAWPLADRSLFKIKI